MKRAILVVLALFLVSGIPMVSHANFVEDYHYSPMLTAGTYIDYTVNGHPSVNEMRMDVIGRLNGSSSIVIVNITLTLLTHQKVHQLQAITVKGTTDDGILVPFEEHGKVTVLTVTSQLAMGSYNFFIRFPIIPPNLNFGDYVTLDERNDLLYGGNGIAVYAHLGDVYNNTFRSEVGDSIKLPSGASVTWIWDSSTGLLTQYNSGQTLPASLFIKSTNAWGEPIHNIYQPTLQNPVLLILNLSKIPLEIFGLYFSYWTLWLASFVLIVLYIGGNYFRGYLKDRKALRAAPDMKRLLNKINIQDQRVSYLDGGKEAGDK